MTGGRNPIGAGAPTPPISRPLPGEGGIGRERRPATPRRP